MKKSNILGLLAMASAFESMGNVPFDNTPNKGDNPGPSKKEIDQKAKAYVHEILRRHKQGQKWFSYANGGVWARNQKNADRKARNNKWIE